MWCRRKIWKEVLWKRQGTSISLPSCSLQNHRRKMRQGRWGALDHCIQGRPHCKTISLIVLDIDTILLTVLCRNLQWNWSRSAMSKISKISRRFCCILRSWVLIYRGENDTGRKLQWQTFYNERKTQIVDINGSNDSHTIWDPIWLRNEIGYFWYPSVTACTVTGCHS